MRSHANFFSFAESGKNDSLARWLTAVSPDWLNAAILPSLSGRITSSRSSVASISLTWLLTCCYKPFRNASKNLGLIWVSYRGTPLAHTSTIGYNQIEMFKPWKNPNGRWKVEKLWFSLTWRTPWDPGNACRKGHDSKLLSSPGPKKTVKQLKAVWKWMNPNGMSWINLKHRPNTV